MKTSTHSFESGLVQKYAEARDKYRPEKARLLWIAESPPSSGGYFYFEITTGRDHLFRETMKALKFWPEDVTMPKDLDKRPLLRKFQSSGFFLLDACQLPVDKLSQAERLEVLFRGLERLGDEVTRLNPDKIVIVKASIFASVREKLKSIGLGSKILNKGPLPFPSHGNQKIYRDRLNQLLGELA